MACKGLDEQVARFDRQVSGLLEQFVCVRIINANGLDLSLFQFDYDLTFAAFFLNADRTIYGRFGTRSQTKADQDISIQGFARALEGAQALDKAYRANPAMALTLAAKTGPAPAYRFPEAMPPLQRYDTTIQFEGEVARSCIHCHMVRETERRMLRDVGKPVPDEKVFPWPMPDQVGITLDRDEAATVRTVHPGSPAFQAGFKPGDRIRSLADQPLVSVADVQWVLHQAKTPGELEAVVERAGGRQTLRLRLESDWRRGSDLSWRPTSWDLRRMATGGLKLESISTVERQRLKLREQDLSLRVQHVGQYGEHATAKQAGFQKDDLIVAFDTLQGNRTETDLFEHVLKQRMPGVSVPVTVLRGERRLDFSLPLK